MKAFLMHRNQDFNMQANPPSNADVLIQDLELSTLLQAMGRGDKFLFNVAKTTILLSLNDPEAIVYRQQILSDCLEHEAIIREIYHLSVEAIEGEKKIWRFSSKSPDSILRGAVDAVGVFVRVLKRLKQIAEEHGAQFHSEGFARFFAMLNKELDDEYFHAVQEHLTRLEFQNGILISAELGKGGKGTNYTLRRPFEEKRSWIKRIFGNGKTAYSFELADRDDRGHQALSELRSRGINLVANALAQSADHILSFFVMLRTELGFYVGSLNLHEQIVRKGEATCIPVPSAHDRSALSARGLYDVCLALKLETMVIGNNLAADEKRLIVITGANQGGKTTFLRSVGLAYLMMQCGMFVPAENFSASICTGIFTHYKRGEDATMNSGKFDEELNRMSGIAERIRPGCILLCNESFSSTNEREGSEIARQLICAFLEADIKVFLVTHLYALSTGFYNDKMDAALFLRAERETDGRRTFRMVEGEPFPTSYGDDLYKQIFGMVDKITP